MPNLFENVPTGSSQELFDTLVSNPAVTIKRIISTGQASPKDFWYDQLEHEWVVVLSGQASLEFQDQKELMYLACGDYVHIAPHRKHRVHSTSADEPTIWLAVFFSG